MDTITVEELAIPAALDGPDAADFIESVAVSSAVEVDAYGTPEMAITADELLPSYRNQQYEPKRLFVIRQDGRIVARGVYHWVTGEPDVAWTDVRVLPEHRGRGLGSAMAAHLVSLGRAQGRARLATYVPSPDRQGRLDRLWSPTGFGSLPADNPEVRFLLVRGWTLEQVVRGSRLALPIPEADLRRRLDAAVLRSGPRFVRHHWADHTPERWLDDMANLYTNMSVEEPSAGLDEPRDEWSAQRVLDTEANNADRPDVRLLAAVEDAVTGHLVGYTELAVPRDLSAPVSQRDTLVLPGSRGHGLGLLLKLANLVTLQRDHPGHPAVLTFNAEENRPMLDVNEALGFVPIGYEGAWKKVLSYPASE
ncbi:Acetyltransferase (GNAT) domain-containing protein [Nakamurella panacisegetis]|uniref:Acetyltransferase (GNAT) domain-containing protein n=1 Tax=Nakamurella panacisegetis TaxID=1090615 RepID=A0A1H0NI71_9ACTN|nr:GNAT family N-acetyltransferase [Nakamurella panacisegetis]SDO92105.1 Acetyltransferase (GNAT) domain-containing protein [Nakamurella panacisegetis]